MVNPPPLLAPPVAAEQALGMLLALVVMVVTLQDEELPIMFMISVKALWVNGPCQTSPTVPLTSMTIVIGVTLIW